VDGRPDPADLLLPEADPDLRAEVRQIRAAEARQSQGVSHHHLGLVSTHWF
jgi:hypothetical protein